MTDKEYKIDNPLVLKEMLMLLSGSNCDFSAYLMPDVPELIEAINTGRTDISGLDIGQLSTSMIQRGKRLDERVLKTLVLLGICKKHNIMPFWSLRFDYELRQFNEPEIKYIGGNFGWTVHDEPFNLCVNPVHFTRESRWYSIEFKEVQGEKNIARCKSAIESFTSNGYSLTSFISDLNPWFKRGEYMDSKECDATIIGDMEKIRVHSEKDEHFVEVEKVMALLREKCAPKNLELKLHD